MLVGDMVQPDGRVLLKSEWAPIADRWPCVDDANVQIARLACNWAKNECADDQFDEAVVRGAEVE